MLLRKARCDKHLAFLSQHDKELIHYTHLTSEERYYISQSLKSGKSKRQISLEINRHVSTVSREILRNSGLRGYRYKQAERKNKERQSSKITPRISKEVWLNVEQMIRQDFSPEQVSGWLALQGVSISHEWIYQHILKDKKNGGTLFSHLRCQRKRKRRYGKPDSRGQIKDRVSIDLRPSIVDERSRLGDWEADCVEGSKGGSVLVTLIERKSRLALVAKSKNKSAKEVTQVILDLLTPIKEYVHTITYDNGKEFSHHAEISKKLEAKSFFAHPYHSWERGLNENTNGLLRQYFPKGVSLNNVTQDRIIEAMCKLNWRARKCLAFDTPYASFIRDANNQIQSVALSN